MKRIEYSLYHSFLRIAVCVAAFVLVFDSGLAIPATERMSSLTQQHLASVVGVTLGVAPNELNQLTARITELETELDAKERLIAVNLQNRDAGEGMDVSTFVLSVIVFILLVLIVLNYALDYVRSRKVIPRYESTTSQVV
jgi:hypothetical protein